MKKLLEDKEIDKLIEEILKEYPLETLLEAPGDPMRQAPVPQLQPRVAKPIQKAPVKAPVRPAPRRVVKKVQPKQIAKPKPTSQTIPGPKDKEPVEKPNVYNPEQAKEKQQMTKTQYQIFNIKMRLGKLGLNDTLRRFAQSIHDFDINVTKNSKDKNDIQSYLSPAQGNLVALKGALESLEAEFDELDKLLDEEKNG